MPSAAIAMCTSTGSIAGAEAALGLPARDDVAQRVDDRPVEVRIACDFFRWRPLAWFSATTSRTKPSCSR